ncbi:hypothetical protein D3C71_1625650 [compost metagenome]
MASGSQACNGSWADFPQAANRMPPNTTRLAVPLSCAIALRAKVPVLRNSVAAARYKPIEAIWVISRAFMAERCAFGVW